MRTDILLFAPAESVMAKSMANSREQAPEQGMQHAGGRPRAYNSKSMNERRARIIAATLELISQEGLGGVTIRNVSKRAGVALRTLYLYFESREAIIGVGIKEFFSRQTSSGPGAEGPATLEEFLARMDWLAGVVLEARSYSAALAPVFLSANLDSGIYEILRGIALSHVHPFIDKVLAASNAKLGPHARELLELQLANSEYAVINDVLSGRLPEEHLATFLKCIVLTTILGHLPRQSRELRAALEQLQASLN